MKKRTAGSIAFDIINSTVLILISCIMLYPILHVLFASVSNSSLVMQHSGPLLRPLGFNLDAYKAVLADERVFNRL